MTHDILILIVGLALLVIGGDVLVRGSVGLARYFGVSTLIVGLTVVAFGTSAPELSVNLTAALNGRGDLSFGNIIGSNIANIGLILGLTALLKPLVVHPSVIKRDIPIMLLATVALVAMCYDQVLYDADRDVIARGDGVILLMIFGMFLIFTVRSALRERRADRKRKSAHDAAASAPPPIADDDDDDAPDPLLAEKEQEVEAIKPPSIALAVVLTLIGLAAVVFGGDLTVDGATAIAHALGISEVVIGLTIVAVGTSLPELATCIMAVRAGHTDIAVGNVVGSNIWNILLILAVTAVVRPIDVPLGGPIDLWVMTALALSLMPIALLRGKRLIGRGPGFLLLVAYAAYIAFRTLQSP